jgi:hypothetical protein
VKQSYIPSQRIEEPRLIVGKQMEIAVKVSAVKNQIHALLERNLLQSEFDDLSDIFGAEGLQRLGSLELPPHEKLTLAMYLEELRLYTSQHRQIEAEVARIAEADEDCKNLMSHPGIGAFVAVAIKARVGDASRFPTKKHFCSYAGVVPKADNTGEHVSEHNHIKHGDDVLKYALTCGVNAAARASTNCAVKRFYFKHLAKGKSPQDAEVAAARKPACIVWKILTSKERYVEEDRYLTARKMSRLSQLVRRPLEHATRPEDVSTLIASLKLETDVLGRCPEEMGRIRRHSGGRGKRKLSSTEHLSEQGGAAAK